MTITSKQKIITLAIAATLFFLMAFLSSCSSSFHLKKAKWHIMKAESKGASVSTIVKRVELTSPGVKTKFDPLLIGYEKEPRVIIKDSIITKIKRVPGKDNIDTIYMEVECPDTNVSADIPCESISTEKSIWWKWLLIGFGIGCFIMALLMFKFK